ncbi:LTA synthase family protein [Tumebacillus sp. BK434]|uniref:LTA synthase family protein n=1 Tax=Tumebacillus sp. BK434 TaxID=2512169 RepID=UPI0014048521|nr:LTA synthase family protein [Tumebacillus sp. BK434]
MKMMFLDYWIGLGIGSPLQWVAALAGLFLLTGLFVLLPKYVRFGALIVVDLAVSFILLADLFFFRNYSRVIPLPMLETAGQLGTVTNEIKNLFSAWDLFLIVDFVLLIPLLLIYGSRLLIVQGPMFSQRLSHAALLIVGSAVLLVVQSAGLVNVYGKPAYTEMYTNNVMVRHMGILSYHAVDAYQYFGGGSDQQLKEQDLNELRAWMDKRRQEPTPKLQGVAKGKNLIIVQMEALQYFLINSKVNGQEVTPHMNKLIQEAMYFDNYLVEVGTGNTSDAEFMTLNSLYPAEAGAIYKQEADNTYRSLPILLKESGYSASYVFHTYKPDFYNRDVMYQAEGFDKFYSESFFKQDDIIGWGPSDRTLYNQSLDVLKEQQNPFMAFYITLSGHTDYKIPEQEKELEIPEGQYSELFTNYLHAQHYADKELGAYMDKLKELGILDNSLFVVYGDHFANGLSKYEIGKYEGIGKEVDDYIYHEQKKVPLFIRLPGGQEAGTYNIPGGQMDLFPTLINMLGIDKNKVFYFGQDLVNMKPEESFSAFRQYTNPNTFATDRLFYLASQDGIFEHGACYDRTNAGALLPIETCRPGFERAKWELKMNDLLVRGDAIPKVVKK